MGRAISGIDHVLIGVADLEAARRQYARLGFTPTPRGRHQGWGTANYCLMFEHDYLELLGIVDPTLFTNNLDRFLEEREGVLGLALASRDPEATAAAWRAAGLASAKAAELTRLLEDETGDAELRFANVMLSPEDLGGLRLFACHHQTPGLLRRPTWLDHPNGAKGLKSMTILVDEPEPVADRLGRILGSGCVTSTDQIWAVHVGRYPMILARPGDAATLHPAFDFPEAASEPLPMLLEIGVAEPDGTAELLAKEGVPHRRARDGSITVQPAEAAGVMLVFVPG